MFSAYNFLYIQGLLLEVSTQGTILVAEIEPRLEICKTNILSAVLSTMLILKLQSQLSSACLTELYSQNYNDELSYYLMAFGNIKGDLITEISTLICLHLSYLLSEDLNIIVHLFHLYILKLRF